ncbi:MAG: fasciclin domain-containing protein [Caldithrix sp.]|nr:fasciclin domain-containing protein [Caldithrix sp.]
MNLHHFNKFFTSAILFVSLVFFNSAHADKCGGSGKMTDHSKTKHDVVELAVKAGSFKTLVAAVKAAGLADALKGDGPFTIFAPTDEAFAKLPEGTLQDLLKPENKDKLKAILTYHVVAGKVTAADVVKISKAETLNGQNAKISVNDDQVFIDDAKIIQTDVMGSNGVIHVIDSVILPQS